MNTDKDNTKQSIRGKLSNYKPVLHPAIKLLSLIVASLFATQGSWFTLLSMGAFMIPFYIIHPDLWHSALKMLIKLKWFFLSIFLIYFYFSPNVSVGPQFNFDLIQQFLPGAFRITVLIIILFAVNLFTRTTSKEQILAALLWLFSPLQRFIDIERISLRAVLTLEYIEILTKKMTEYKNDSSSAMPKPPYENNLTAVQTLKYRLRQKKLAFYHLVNQSGIILRDILDEAKQTSGKSYEIEYLPAPMLAQYFLPVLVFVLLLLTF